MFYAWLSVNLKDEVSHVEQNKRSYLKIFVEKLAGN